MRPRFTRPAVAAAMVAAATAPAGAALFADSFEPPAETAGNNPTLWDVSNGAITVSSAAASDGSNSLFVRDGPNRAVTLKSAVDLAGAPGLEISFDFAQLSSTETGEGLIGFDIDFGGGFETVLVDQGGADGGGGTYTGAALTLSDANGAGAVGFTSYSITIPQSYYGDASTFRLRFRTNSSAGSEDFQLDNIVVTAVPEPAAGLLVGLGGACLLARPKKGLSRR